VPTRPKVVAIIPARYASTRFPGKPLFPLAGKPMILHVAERVDAARKAGVVTRFLVATDDSRIADVVRAAGFPVQMTSPDHPTGTDRIAEVAAGLDEEIVVNIQGDEPLIEGAVIDAAVDALIADPSVPMSTVVHPADPDALDDPNRVKVVMDLHGRALYFSRSRIPYVRDGVAMRMWQHVGLYAYRRAFLLEFVKLAPTGLERAESLEQLRALENGYPIKVATLEGAWRSVPVDVPSDIDLVEAVLRKSGRC
jgi:3-deoxy-manno-octulosonate cytidylyltransferase (CMP-KDO synthetase)